MVTDYQKQSVLIRELNAGRETAFDYLFRSHYVGLCRFACSFLNDYMQAEDLVQNVFLNIWNRKQFIDGNQSVESYLYVSVRNACFTYLKNKKECVSLDELFTQESAMPEEKRQDISDLQILRNEVENLPLQCKIIFKLVVWEEMTYPEIASRLDISVNTVKSQVKIAYKLLRERLRPYRTMFFLYLFHKYILSGRTRKQ